LAVLLEVVAGSHPCVGDARDVVVTDPHLFPFAFITVAA
jgi:hypothetical protein